MAYPPPASSYFGQGHSRREDSDRQKRAGAGLDACHCLDRPWAASLHLMKEGSQKHGCCLGFLPVGVCGEVQPDLTDPRPYSSTLTIGHKRQMIGDSPGLRASVLQSRPHLQ